MKTIYTSGFGMTNRLPANHPQVSIARFSPQWWKPPGGRLYERRLSPSKELLAKCKQGMAHDEWVKAYRNQIIEAGELNSIIESLPDGCVMLCWEKEWNDCHRKVAWELLQEYFGIAGGEWMVDRILPGLFT